CCFCKCLLEKFFMTRLIVLGLDSATFDLIIPWVNEGRLPNFEKLLATSAWGSLVSTLPPITAVAWNSFATGKNPGKHGVFDFVARAENSYQVSLVNGGQRRAEPYWRMLDNVGIAAGVVNMPMTYPPDQLENGFMISGFDAPGTNANFAYPESLKPILKKNNYVISPLAKSRKEWVEKLSQSFEVQEKTFFELMEQRPWNLLTMVFMQLDVVHHLFWREMDEQDPIFGEVILNMYQRVDEMLGRLLGSLDHNTNLMIVSDHGAGHLKKAVSINQWLWEKQLLHFRETKARYRVVSQFTERSFGWMKRSLPDTLKSWVKSRFGWLRDKAETALTLGEFDWEKTKAFSVGEYGGVFINVAGREPHGSVQQSEYEKVRDEIIDGLQTLRDPVDGATIVRKVWRREELYTGSQVSSAPDLILEWGFAYDCHERAGGGQDSVFSDNIQYQVFANYRKTGVHRRDGIIILHGEPIKPGRMSSHQLVDATSTLLYLLEQPIPDDFDGQLIYEAIKPYYLRQHAP
ncbi:MAG: alkaline phosphatase family protein, partial [Anaerolineae bacterium]|nr:alkaline phosphatase family protein [Anaerolineae bacterium]